MARLWTKMSERGRWNEVRGWWGAPTPGEFARSKLEGGLDRAGMLLEANEGKNPTWSSTVDNAGWTISGRRQWGYDVLGMKKEW